MERSRSSKPGSRFSIRATATYMAFCRTAAMEHPLVVAAQAVLAQGVPAHGTAQVGHHAGVGEGQVPQLAVFLALLALRAPGGQASLDAGAEAGEGRAQEGEAVQHRV